MKRLSMKVDRSVRQNKIRQTGLPDKTDTFLGVARGVGEGNSPKPEELTCSTVNWVGFRRDTIEASGL